MSVFVVTKILFREQKQYKWLLRDSVSSVGVNKHGDRCRRNHSQNQSKREGELSHGILAPPEGERGCLPLAADTSGSQWSAPYRNEWVTSEFGGEGRVLVTCLENLELSPGPSGFL